jgi:hypothetical protein
VDPEHHIKLDQHVCDHHHQQPMTDGSDKNNVMASLEDVSSPTLLLHECKDAEELAPANMIASFPTEVPSTGWMDSYRFPTRNDPSNQDGLPRSRRPQHSYHQSLPYNITQKSRYLGVPTLTPSEEGSVDKASEESPQEVSTDQDVESHTNQGTAMSKRTTEMGPSRLRRAGSCSNISHRPTLSFNSSKKALLSLQDRRLNKPDAKIHRLPGIRTSATGSMLSDGTGVMNRSGRSDSTTSRPFDLDGHALDAHELGYNPSGRTSRRDSEGYHMQVSEKDREAVESILTEVMTSLEYKLDAIQTHRYGHSRSHSRKLSHGSVADSHLSDKPGMIDLPLVLEEPDQFRASLEHFTTTAFDASLSTTSEASETVSDPIDDAVETKRFVKRSHALQELLATEESYINDLDILMHVRLVTSP